MSRRLPSDALWVRRRGEPTWHLIEKGTVYVEKPAPDPVPCALRWYCTGRNVGRKVRVNFACDGTRRTPVLIKHHVVRPHHCRACVAKARKAT